MSGKTPGSDETPGKNEIPATGEMPGDGWKERLDRLDNLPGEPWVGKKAAWDALYGRLEEAPREASPLYRLRRIWAAAVLVLLAAGISVVFWAVRKDPASRSGVPVRTLGASRNKPDSVHPKTGSAIPPTAGGSRTAVTASPLWVPRAANATAAAETGIPAAGSPLRGAKGSASLTALPGTSSPASPGTKAHASLTDDAFALPGTSSPASLPDNAFASPGTKVTALPRPALPVVSVNELQNDPGAGSPVGGGRSDNRFLQFKVLNKAFSSETAAESSPVAGPLIKIHR